MKTILVVLSFLTVVLLIARSASSSAQTAGQPPAAPSSKLVLQDGTPVKLRLSRNLSSADAKVGDTVDFEVLEEVRVGSTLTVPKGGIAWATITEAQPKRRMARGGKLGVNIDAVRLVDGERAALRAVKEVKGGGHTGAMTGGMVATGIVFFPAAPFFLFMHGKDITIPKGTEITAYVNGDFPLNETSPHPVSQNVPGNEPTASQTTIQVSSIPPGADVEIDGSFVGNTPSSVAVPTGEHTVKVSKTSFKSWERTIKTLGGNVQLSPTLQPEPAAGPSVEQK